MPSVSQKTVKLFLR
jgi:hypothetical protein